MVSLSHCLRTAGLLRFAVGFGLLGGFAIADEVAQPEVENRLQLNEVLFRDRDHNSELRQARRELAAGRTSAGLEVLQRMLDEDSFQWDENSGNLTTTRREVAEIFAGLTPAILADYERLVGAEARQMLDDIRAQGRMDLLPRFLRRFYFTAAGFDAVDWLAAHWTDHGEHRRAARYWRRIINDPVHARRVTPRVLLKAATAHRLAGLEEESGELLARMSRSKQRLGGQTVDAVDWVQQLVIAFDDRGTTSDWLLQGGNASRNGVTRGSPPALTPLWSNAPAGKARDLGTHRWKESDTNITARVPLIVGSRLIVRDREGVRAHNLHSGELLWQYPSDLSKFNPQTLLSLDEQGRPSSTSADQLVDRFQSMLASDGGRVFVVELQTERAERPASPDEGGEWDPFDALPRLSTRLVALDAYQAGSGEANSISPVWTVGDTNAGLLDGDALQGHTIIGPPMPVDGVVYVMTEYDRQISLVALSAATGELLWSQGVGLAKQPIWFPEELSRLLTSYTPAYADGVIVCPTAIGMLAGMDALTGELLWARYYGEAPEPNIRRFQNSRQKTWQNEPAFADAPHIHNGMIVFLPTDSPYLHCFDLQTGSRLWRVPREDAEFVGAITDRVVVLVGKRRVQGLGLKSGTAAWEEPLRVELPAGRGAHLGESYLLPLQSGAVANIKINSGALIGVPFSISPRSRDLQQISQNTVAAHMGDRRGNSYGNLVASGDMIVSVGPDRVTVFPQASKLLANLQHDPPANLTSTEVKLQMAELHMVIGDDRAAGEVLSRLLGSTLEQADRSRAEWLMRELLYHRLDSGSGDGRTLLSELERLSHTPWEQGRYLVRQVAFDLEHGQTTAVTGALVQFAALATEGLFADPDDVRLRLSPRSWIASVRRRLFLKLSDTERDELLQSEGQQARHLLNGEASDEQLERFLLGHPESPGTSAVRVELAARLFEQGQYQRSELLLLAALGDKPEAAIEARARKILVELWTQAGLYEEAGTMLAELAAKCSGVTLPDGQVVDDYLASFSRKSLTWLAYRRCLPLNYHVSNVAIEEHRWLGGDPKLADIYNARRASFLTPDSSSFDLLNAGPRGKNRITLVDRFSGTRSGEIAMPSGWRYPQWARSRSVGHFIPIGSTHGMHGLSLLEHENEIPLWSQSLNFDGGTDPGEVHVGPAGPEFATFQSKQGQVLTAVEPATGRILWQRTDLEPNSGLFGSPQLGLFGDEDVLVLFEKDGKNYTVLRTKTGEQVRRGRLEIDPHYQPYGRGRRLLFYAALAGGRRLQIWNAVSDRFELEEPFIAGHNSQNDQTGELAILDQLGGRFRILDLDSGRSKVDVTLVTPASATVRAVRFFDDAERYYVNLQTYSNAAPRGRSNWVPDTYLPNEQFYGEMYAIRKADGKVIWHRTIPQRSILQFPNHRLPFLVMLAKTGPSRMRREPSGNRIGIVPLQTSGDSMLVEVLDVETGRLITKQEHILTDRLVLSHYDPDAGLLQLFGVRSRLDFKFEHSRQQLYWDDQPL